jgi:hypothetical protein
MCERFDIRAGVLTDAIAIPENRFLHRPSTRLPKPAVALLCPTPFPLAWRC